MSGLKLPYIVTIIEDTGQVLAVRRNYEEADIMKKAQSILCALQIFARSWFLWSWVNAYDWWFGSSFYIYSSTID